MLTKERLKEIRESIKKFNNDHPDLVTYIYCYTCKKVLFKNSNFIFNQEEFDEHKNHITNQTEWNKKRD